MKYGLTWDQEKNPETIVTQTDAGVPFIEEIKELTVKGQDTQHILIDSDNYPALKILNQTHKNAVDIICIDPPYNTGNEFIYNDKRVDEEDDYRHSKWLNFMDKRIRLSYDLLKEDGVFYCFIGHDELANLTLLCDQIFGVNNRVNTIARKTFSGKGLGKNFLNQCDYILVYAKNIEYANFYETVEHSDGLEDNKGPYLKTRYTSSFKGNETSNQYYPITTPDGTLIYPKTGDVWRYSYETYLNKKENNELIFSKYSGSKIVDKQGNPSVWKVEAKDYNITKQSVLSNLFLDVSFQNKNGDAELKALFNEKKVFDYPKPTALIQHLIDITNKTNDITILDFFAGSGTMAHAVMNMNEEDLGSRQSISIALNDIDDEADICTDVTYERLKIVVKNIQDKYQGQLDLTAAGNPTLKYLKVQILDYQSETQSILIEKNNKETLCQ